MKQLLKICAKSNRLNLKNQAKLKEKVRTIQSAFKPYQIEFPFKTELDFYLASLHHQGLINKQAFEQVFESQRIALIDIWEHLSYQEKNRLIQIRQNEVKNDLRHFRNSAGKVIWIPFFDELLNGLYHTDLAIFELEQYYRLYKNFKDRRIDVKHYGLEPFRSGYLDISPLIQTDHAFYFYDAQFKSLFALDERFDLIRIPLSKDACQIHPMKKDLLELAQAFDTQDPSLFLGALLESALIDEKCKTKLIKMQKKGKLS